MKYRELGHTGLKVSSIGLGCVQLASSRTEVAVPLVRRALELGVTYFDVAKGYGDAEIKVGLGVADCRDSVVLSTKTGAKTREQAREDIHNSLVRLGTDYLDNVHLHALRSGEDMDKRLGPDGALEALIEAKQEGLIHHIGCSVHRSAYAIEAIQRFPFEVILVPMNIVEREPLDALIPLCQEKGIGVTIMKPVATGLLPASLALKWLLNQPIATAVPGGTTLEEITENSMVGHRELTLTPEEQERIQEIRASLEHVRCRVCGACMPCLQEIVIPMVLGTDVMFDHHRTMGPEGFRAFPWSAERIEREMKHRPHSIETIESCTRCGACEPRCPYGLPIMDMLTAALPEMRDMVAAYEDIASAPVV
ncbi:MAG: aldo/keto reductase [Anaerolineae bacterium]|nr:aldo/keto reductase [Anaerolineae bacterium]